MEPIGVQRLLTRLTQQYQLQIGTLITDKNSSVIRMVQREFGNMRHRFDLWHLMKNFIKAMRQVKKHLKNKTKGQNCRKPRKEEMTAFAN